LCELAAKRRGIDEVDERALPADLHDRQPLAIALLQLGHAGDVDLVELERELGLELRQRRARPLAEVTAGGAEQPDLRYG